jgi:tRNA/tmRNA/rRNA uracil-C5-methylase (TrmA/RlmC/RlmD family)
MKVAELIEMLQQEDQNADVHFSYNYGDHWRTQVAPSVDSVEQGIVEYSSYHSMDKMVDHEDLYDEETGDYIEGVRRVVVLG